MKYDLAVSGAVILCGTEESPFIGSVGIRNGRIGAVTKERILPSECEEWIDGSDRILLPGLVNAHCHGDMTLARGLSDDKTLQEQNEAYADTNWFFSLITDGDRASSRLLTYAECLLHGITFQMENMYWSLGRRSAELMQTAGIFGAPAEDIRYDFSRPDGFLSDEDLDGFTESCRANGLIPVIGSISEEDYEETRNRRIQEICRSRGLIRTFHMTETTWRLDMIRERYGTTPVRWLSEHDVLGSDVIGSHVVHLDREEVGLLAESGTSVVNTPLCEMKIADGIAPVTEMLRQGVNVCLGTDGAMWNNSNDIFREMKGMALLQTITNGIRSISAKDVFAMATKNGAKAFGMEEETGTIEEGKRGDVILLRADVPHMQPLVLGQMENVTSSVVFNATGSDVTDTVVNGRRVVKEGKLMTLDLKDLYERVGRATAAITAHYEGSVKKL